MLAKAARSTPPSSAGRAARRARRLRAEDEVRRRRRRGDPASRGAADDDDDNGAERAAWTIQVGATDDADDARDLLARAKSRHRALAAVRGFTEKVRKHGDTLYRVRFAGLDSASAAKACRDLKHGGLDCFTTRE